jgi:hypothetical protein
MKMTTIPTECGLIVVALGFGTKMVHQPMKEYQGIRITIWTVLERWTLTFATTIVPILDKVEIGDREQEVALLSVECQLNKIGTLTGGLAKTVAQRPMEGMNEVIKAI